MECNRKSFNFEDVFNEVGSFGPFQVRVFLLVSAFEAPAAWMLLQHIFTAARPSSWACPGETRDFISNSSTINANILDISDGQDVQDNNQTGFLCHADGMVCPGRIYSPDYTSISTEWDLVCDRASISTWIMTLQMAGVLVGACLGGQMADTWGRRKVLFIAYALLLLAGFSSAFANSWQLYAVMKFLVGVFFGGTLLVNFVLPLEFVGRSWRTFCGCVGFWACGVMSLALIAYLVRDWRHLAIVTSLCGLPLLLTWRYIPESPRWLIQKGRHEEAAAILCRVAEFNKRPIVDFSKLQCNFDDEVDRNKQNIRYTYLDLFHNCSMTKNTVILLYTWFTCSSVYYGSSLNVGSLSGNKYVNFFLSGLVEIPPLVFVVIVNNRLGRRKTLFFLFILSGGSMLAATLVHILGNEESLHGLTVGLFMVGRAGIAGSWAATQIFSAETFPTVVRNIGVGACSMSSRIGGIVAPHMVSLNSVSQPLPFILFGGLALLAGLLSLLLPETLNSPLPDELAINTHWCCRRRRDLSELEMESVDGHKTVTAVCTQTNAPVNGCQGGVETTFDVVDI